MSELIRRLRRGELSGEELGDLAVFAAMCLTWAIIIGLCVLGAI